MSALADHNIQLSVEPDDDRLLAWSYRRIRFALFLNKLDLVIPVDDEDADRNNPALMLHLVLSACEIYEEADDFLVWARETGFDASENWVQALYADLADVVPKIREKLGPDIKPLSSHDFSLNAGAARALRDQSS